MTAISDDHKNWDVDLEIKSGTMLPEEIAERLQLPEPLRLSFDKNSERGMRRGAERSMVRWIPTDQHGNRIQCPSLSEQFDLVVNSLAKTRAREWKALLAAGSYAIIRIAVFPGEMDQCGIVKLNPSQLLRLVDLDMEVEVTVYTD